MIAFDLMYRILPEPHDGLLSVYHLLYMDQNLIATAMHGLDNYGLSLTQTKQEKGWVTFLDHRTCHSTVHNVDPDF